MTEAQSQPQPRRERRPVRERFRDFLEHSVPLDKAGDDRFEDLLDQLRDERDRRTDKGSDDKH